MSYLLCANRADGNRDNNVTDAERRSETNDTVAPRESTLSSLVSEVISADPVRIMPLARGVCFIVKAIRRTHDRV